jgi:hypothetical protein
MHIPRVKFDPQNIDLGPDMDGRMRNPSPIENPWLKLPSDAPYVLEIDRKCIERYNEKKRSRARKIDTSLIPEPFIGNPRSAKLVLLNLNPGLAEDDAEAHTRPDLKAAMFLNLRHESQQYPFYPLNPQFEKTPCAKWWLRITGRLIQGLDVACVAEKLLVIEWFPYHSQESGLPKDRRVCESQQYSCQLVQEMRARGAFMVLLRSQENWAICDKHLSKLPLPNSRENPVISATNFGEKWFNQMRRSLSECHERADLSG